MYYVSDTHSFIWYLLGDKRLSKKAKDIFSLCEAGEAVIVIPAIVILECIDVFDKKKVNLKFGDVILRISQADNFLFSELNWSLILEINKTKGFKDLHDRTIVATAKIFDALLISKDAIIRKRYPKTIW